MTAQRIKTANDPRIGDLRHSVISAFSYAGFCVTTPNGEPAMLAVVDKDGNVIESGADVAIAAWNVAIHAYRNFLQGAGHLRVHAGPPQNESA
ncbi:hypothetical protein [Paraburkholderia phenoliruptrix]|uniref:hypothetical protein n=1 Tax=Paraburkholderia phenoliruptrix TaxID=252970 RepID=UPI0001C02FCE|nr:hypothetical protein [Paraburkholderia phenoliruptrix]MDR6392274.1 hypothetical protein [Paraburkholderia phenoliruptrix]